MVKALKVDERVGAWVVRLATVLDVQLPRTETLWRRASAAPPLRRLQARPDNTPDAPRALSDDHRRGASAGPECCRRAAQHWDDALGLEPRCAKLEQDPRRGETRRR